MSGRDERPIKKKADWDFTDFLLTDWEFPETDLDDLVERGLQHGVFQHGVFEQPISNLRYCPRCGGGAGDIELRARVRDRVDNTWHYAFVCSNCGNVFRVSEGVRLV